MAERGAALAGEPLALAGCSRDDGVAPAPVTPVDPATVNEYVKALPDWEVPDDTELEPVVEAAEEEFNGSAYLRCETVVHDRKQNFDNLIAVGEDLVPIDCETLLAPEEVGSGRRKFTLLVRMATENSRR